MINGQPGRGINTDFKEFWQKRGEEREAGASFASLDDVQYQLDKLTLVCMAMWSILKEKTSISEEELLKRVEQIDLSDGKQDGRFRKQIAICPQCNRPLSAKHNRCLYCGYVPPAGDFAAFLSSPPPPADPNNP